MTIKPDFIVDPSGNVRDVRHLKESPSVTPPGEGASTSRSAPRRAASPKAAAPHVNSSYSAPDNLAGNFYRGKVVQVSYPSTNRSGSTPYWIPIPIGLIITLIAVLLQLFGRSSSQPTANTVSYDEFFEMRRAVGYYLNGSYALALDSFNSIIRSRPNLSPAYNGRGLVYHDLGQYDKALADFNRAIELLPRSAIAYSNRGITYFARADYDRAIEDLDKAIELDTDCAKAYFNRGLVYYTLDDMTAALNNFDQAIRYTPESSQHSEPQGTPDAVARLVGNSADYEELYSTVIDLTEAYYWRAMININQGHAEQAIQDLEKAKTLHPKPDLTREIDSLLQLLKPYKAQTEG